MSKVFNVSADCKPNLHYMVDISELLHKIKKFIERGEYFTINRARQYGKTTTLRALRKLLENILQSVSIFKNWELILSKMKTHFPLHLPDFF